MELILKERDIKTLKEEKDGWAYSIKTNIGKMTGSSIATKEEAIKHAAVQCVRILEAMLRS